MRKFHRSAFTVASLSALAFAFGGAQSALANSWGSHGSFGGSWGSHGSFGGSHGSIGGLFHHHGSWGSHGSSGGSYGSYGSSGGSYGWYGSSGGSYGSSGGSYGSYGSDGGYYTASYTAAPIAKAGTAVAYLNVKVPGDAKVYLQDQLMTTTGTRRRFVTPAIKRGYQSNYTVKVEVVRNGQTITKTAQATVPAGQEVDVVVSFDGQNPKELVASVTQTASR
ncbi:MAG: TIGR03000 domain-containing protein [Planctomycetaceae bacterium]|nr:TIGR03000 domain-containing protein [Planctomycetaceae bacterium]